MNNDLQTNTQKTKDCVRQILLESKGELGCSGRINSSCPTNGTRRRATLVTLLLVLKTNIQYHKKPQNNITARYKWKYLDIK